MEHFFSYKRHVPRSENKYPHIMHWIDVRVCDNEIGYGMHKNMLCHAC